MGGAKRRQIWGPRRSKSRRGGGQQVWGENRKYKEKSGKLENKCSYAGWKRSPSPKSGDHELNEDNSLINPERRTTEATL
jgi:hypothetical protein